MRATTPGPGPEDHVEGSLERVVYENRENAWCVVRVRVEGEREPVTAVGSLAGIQPGERLRLTGAWVTDPKFGRQFQVAAYRSIQPSTVEGIEKYLASGMLKGIGPEMAKRLVAAFGADTLEVIDQTPERLREVPGIGQKRSQDIAQGFRGQRQLREVMVFLQSHGVAAHLAVKIAKRYGDDALGLVRTDPYRLARDVAGIGFLTADEIARRLGISRDAPERVRAAVLHLLGEAASGGHVFLPEGELVRQVSELLTDGSPDFPGPETVDEAIRHLAAEGEVVLESHDATADGRAVFSAELHEAETTLARRLLELLEHPVRPIEIDGPRAVEWFEDREGIELAAEQRSAIVQATTAKVLVITGGPGTGKTTLVRGIVEILRLKGRRIRLAAPTGRAAKRLSEATGQAATTLHRLLEFDPKTGGFVRDREHPVEADLVIVDEASMIDTPLAASLVEALPDAAQLVLVGDIDQLPSVGPGSVLSDAIDSGAVAVVRLEAIFRQAQESLIVGNAHRVNRGEMPISAGDDDPRRDFFFIERSDPERVLEVLTEVVARRIPQSFGLDPFEDLQVLSPMNRGLLGVHQLNRTLRDLLNPMPPGQVGQGAREVTRGSRSFRVGDKVMQTRNNYELDVFNGDLGRITALHEDEEEITVRFDGREIAYPFSDLDELSLAYACSIHKSQGSEYPAVVVPLHTQHFVMLERNLLYTALTRARRLVVLVGDPRALSIAVRNRKNRARHTRLAERLAG